MPQPEILPRLSYENTGKNERDDPDIGGNSILMILVEKDDINKFIIDLWEENDKLRAELINLHQNEYLLFQQIKKLKGFLEKAGLYQIFSEFLIT